jgi:hypothetical protein
MSAIAVEKSSKFFIVRNPNWGTSFYMPYCDLDKWNEVNEKLNMPEIDYAFMSEGGGFVLNGNKIADALVNYQVN